MRAEHCRGVNDAAGGCKRSRWTLGLPLAQLQPEVDVIEVDRKGDRVHAANAEVVFLAQEQVGGSVPADFPYQLVAAGLSPVPVLVGNAIAEMASDIAEPQQDAAVLHHAFDHSSFAPTALTRGRSSCPTISSSQPSCSASMSLLISPTFLPLATSIARLFYRPRLSIVALRQEFRFFLEAE